MSPRRPPVLIVGVGNELLGDEGLGVHVARSLLALKPLPEGVEVIEAGTAFFDVLPDLAGRTRVIIVDAIRMGGEPGAVYRAELDGEPGAEAAKAGSLSLHDSGVW